MGQFLSENFEETEVMVSGVSKSLGEGLVVHGA